MSDRTLRPRNKEKTVDKEDSQTLLVIPSIEQESSSTNTPNSSIQKIVDYQTESDVSKSSMSGMDINHPTIQNTIQDATPSLAPRAPSPTITDFSSLRDNRERTRFPEKFADNKSEVDFEAWKMEMKIMIDDHPLEFNTTEKQIRA
ncbi:hypothetical protein GcM1_208039 [Golovinomyces cichoracearum]|uniref:Uncharacterized protein n=1 Tax=Golovinomyces cichoracearum TaxID=62708 RepID=A0A420IWE3_9PEZI|nr:hypothetical protein GcM1_208039 [Golovinomyces cichoracearum]